MSEQWFNGCHHPDGIYSSLKGSMLQPYELDALVGENEGEVRYQGETPTTHDWNTDVVVTTGMTGGGGAMAK